MATEQVKEKIRGLGLTEYAQMAMTRYGKAVNEDRALPDYRDGMKPVQRKILWGMYKLGLWSKLPKPVKSARIVGDVLGKFHPHGDTACYGAMVTMANQVVPTVFGEGNWGNILKDSPAAMRYTNAKLTAYGDAIFDPYYTPVMDLLPNYDDTEQEPLVLYTPLPNALVNGSYGIGVGTTCYIPAFDVASVAKVTIKALQLYGTDKTISPKTCATLLKFVCEGGGRVDQEHYAAEILDYMKTGEGSVVFNSRWTWDSKLHGMAFTGFAPVDINKKLELISAYPEVVEILDLSSIEEGFKFVVVMKRLDNKLLTAAKKKVAGAFSSKENFKTNITERVLLNGKRDVVNRSTTIPALITDWVKWRVQIEVRATQFQIGVMDKKIRHTELLRIAVANRSLIIKMLDSDLDDAGMEAELAKRLKITPAEAKVIFDLRVRQLKKLEDKGLEKLHKEQTAQRATLQGRAKDPAPWVIKNIEAIVAKLKG